MALVRNGVVTRILCNPIVQMDQQIRVSEKLKSNSFRAAFFIVIVFNKVRCSYIFLIQIIVFVQF